ncbi:MAG: hypothetical protein WCT77_08315 [Bacteroidota bacterium]
MSKDSKYILWFLVIFIIAYMIFSRFKSAEDSSTYTGITKTQIIYDTIIKTIPSKPIIINKVKTKLVKVKDTVIQTEPFAASIDTIVNTDTIKALYEFPENLMSLRINKKPDSLLLQRITVFQPVEKKVDWWEKPALFLGGAIIGLTIGVAIK